MSNAQQLEELQLIQFTLLPEEILTFLDDEGPVWSRLLDDYGEDAAVGEAANFSWPSAPPHIQVKPRLSKIWFEVQFPSLHNPAPSVAVKGENVTRAEQERWQNVIQEKMGEITTSEVPVYELLCLYLLPLLHNEIPTAPLAEPLDALRDDTSSARLKFHALFTSHHLISPKKRRSLQQWSNSLRVMGFAKGEQGSVEEFVENVKAMQWLALRLRFLEPLPISESDEAAAQGWTEFEKVGEAVEAMRRLGLENWIVEMGIGSAGSRSS
ncbi:hypothetical protein K438DRAFT_1819434 [Mycena galopus ATCC 62051]|nr:hypothetical protein K438DRAFT_1819434 [Mycena galopus ATCC 62051]